MNPIDDVKQTRANHTNAAINEAFGFGSDDAKTLRTKTSLARDEVDRAEGTSGLRTSKGPGIFKRIGNAFKSLGSKIASVFRPAPPAPAISAGTPQMDGTAQGESALTRERNDSERDLDEQSRRYGATLTARQAREAAQSLNPSGEQKARLNVTLTPQEAKEYAQALTEKQNEGKSQAHEGPGIEI
jgi:hypothetical protein